MKTQLSLLSAPASVVITLHRLRRRSFLHRTVHIARRSLRTRDHGTSKQGHRLEQARSSN